MHAPLDPARPYVFMANHASMVDIWAMFVAIPASFRFIAKKQLANIPLFGWAMSAGQVHLHRPQNAASARRTMALAAQRIRSGQSVVIFPEGTRTRDGRLGAFKKGGFHLAMESGADIVPVAIRGSRDVMPPRRGADPGGQGQRWRSASRSRPPASPPTERDAPDRRGPRPRRRDAGRAG